MQFCFSPWQYVPVKAFGDIQSSLRTYFTINQHQCGFSVCLANNTYALLNSAFGKRLFGYFGYFVKSLTACLEAVFVEHLNPPSIQLILA
jgi:hypothetical protein